ncbi:hypothetical protein M422DRAFT_28647 [Sphaerobolus stellatus SS14]|uniref:SigF-like NTF2-like domain-containing protein n=1 Tax=Sphaerobolus stellatus (strain SS14) TaxID=990650 RepID=A0A0C9VVV3_SPHS4|nr:hypothetical protein M422DRAFT_28647 [Sphaerobolus stellatus SS14]
MQDPEREIGNIVLQLTTSTDADKQQAAIDRYFTHDASLDHPVVKVNPSIDSRQSILHIFVFYRFGSSRSKLQVLDVVYNPDSMKIFVNISHEMSQFFNPFAPTHGNMLVQLDLVKRNKLYYIKVQNDYYMPEELVSLNFPFFVPILNFVKQRVNVILLTLAVSVLQTWGFWRVSTRR